MSTGYNPKIVTDGLIVCLDAANSKSYPGSGTTWYDISGKNNHFTLSGSYQFNSKYAGSLVLDSANTASAVGSSPEFTFEGDYAIDVWFRNTSPSANYGIIFTAGNGNGLGPNLRFGDGGFEYKLQCGVNLTDASTCFSTSITRNSSQDQWLHAVLTRTSDVNTLWINGVQQNLGNYTPSEYPLTSFTDGTWTYGPETLYISWNGYSLLGNINTFKVYNRGLSKEEIQQNYNAIKGRFNIPSDGLLLDLDAGNTASYPGSGTTWYDLSSHGYTGTFYSSPTFDGTVGAAGFDGSNYTNHGTYFNFPTDITIDVWFKSDSPVWNGGNLYDQLENYGHRLQLLNNDTYPYIWIINNEGYGFDRSLTSSMSGAVTTDVWHNIVLTGDNNSINSYYDGTLDTSVNVPFSPNSTPGYPFYVGSCPDFGEGFKGKIATFKAYNRALSASEVTQNYNLLKGRFGL